MAGKFTISLDKIIEEFKLETIYTPKDATEIQIDEADVTRPGLQLMGFYEYFNPERIQIIGKMEFAYLSTIDEETRVQRLDMLFSQRIPALVISRELPYFEEMLDLGKEIFSTAASQQRKYFQFHCWFDCFFKPKSCSTYYKTWCFN